MSEKKTVVVLEGGRSGEHEISLLSAKSIRGQIDSKRYNVESIHIDKEGHWPKKELESLIAGIQKGNPKKCIVFPAMHGPLCEDGVLQGFLELLNLPYVGAGVKTSAVAMDKRLTKQIAELHEIPIVPYYSLKKNDRKNFKVNSIQSLGFPLFVKPSQMGSSVGVSKVKDEVELEKALDLAFDYDEEVLIEKSIRAKEVEVSVLEDFDGKILASLPGELKASHEFYSYEAKYEDPNGAEFHIPAEIPKADLDQIQNYAKKIFEVLDGEGLARVDFFYDLDDQKIYLNELNTMPGFTQISMYPKLWEASGKSYTELLTHLIELAEKRFERKEKLNRSYT